MFKHTQTWKDFILCAFNVRNKLDLCNLTDLPKQQRTVLIVCVKYDENKQPHMNLLPPLLFLFVTDWYQL